MKIITAIAALTLICSSVFGQIEVDLSNPNPVDSTIATYTFCMMIPVRIDGFVTLQCKDSQGQMYYMRIREDLFHGKITIQIHPNEELGPPTSETIWNWHILPDVQDSTGTLEVEYL